MARSRPQAASAFLAALTGPPQRSQEGLLALLHPRASFMTLGKTGEGAADVVELLQAGPNGELARKLLLKLPMAWARTAL